MPPQRPPIERLPNTYKAACDKCEGVPEMITFVGIIRICDPCLTNVVHDAVPAREPEIVCGSDHDGSEWCSRLGQSHQCGKPAPHHGEKHKCGVCGKEWQ